MCTYLFAKKALTLHLARGEGRERYFGCNLMQRNVLASSHQHLMAEAPYRTPFQRLVVSIIVTLDALLESYLLGTAAELRTSLHLYP